ncbi:hypothetical protein D3C83_125710 [compost metagenome]
MRLLQFILLLDHDRRRRTRAATVECARPRATLATVERSSDELDQPIVIDVSRRGHDQIAI